jgi:hypothetical protein
MRRAARQAGELALDLRGAGARLLLRTRLLDLELTIRRSTSSSSVGSESISIRSPARRLVDEVDRLVGQEAVRDVAVRQHGRGHERAVLDADAVIGPRSAP